MERQADHDAASRHQRTPKQPMRLESTKAQERQDEKVRDDSRGKRTVEGKANRSHVGKIEYIRKPPAPDNQHRNRKELSSNRGSVLDP